MLAHARDAALIGAVLVCVAVSAGIVYLIASVSP